MTRRNPVSSQITRRSKSNLAFALLTLPRTRKRDMISFYAFCRVIDDIADEPGLTPEQRQQQLTHWRQGILHGFANPDELQREIAALPARYAISPSLLAEIIDGVQSDLSHHRYPTYPDLLSYCYKVASAVGLVSIEIFGYQNPATKDYAINLGYALQLTNIIRDVGEDARNGRIYLPLEDLRHFNVSEDDILNTRHTPGFVALMQHQHQRAEHFYQLARQQLPREDRRQMIAARVMARIYHEVLHKIHASHYPVFHTRIGISKLRKLIILGTYTVRSLLHIG